MFVNYDGTFKDDLNNNRILHPFTNSRGTNEMKNVWMSQMIRDSWQLCTWTHTHTHTHTHTRTHTHTHVHTLTHTHIVCTYACVTMVTILQPITCNTPEWSYHSCIHQLYTKEGTQCTYTSNTIVLYCSLGTSSNNNWNVTLSQDPL